MSVTQTEFAYIKLFCCTSSIPVFLDEYRIDDMEKKKISLLLRYLRRVYGGEIEQRGRADQTLINYRLSSPMCIGGEERADDPALVDRMVTVVPDRNVLETHKCYKEAYKRIETFDIGLLALPYIQFALRQDTDADYRLAVEAAEQAIAEVPGGDNISHRCRDNLHVIVFGLKMFEKFAEQLGVEIPVLDYTAAVSGSIVDLMDGEKGAKSQLDHFLETCSVLAHNGTLIENTHYAVIEQQTCLHLRSCWEVYLEHKRKTGQQVDASALRALRRLLRENHERSGYVKELSKIVIMSDRRVRTIALDIEQAGEFLDVESFPISQERAWGGARHLTPLPYKEED
jgi:DNA primase